MNFQSFSIIQFFKKRKKTNATVDKYVTRTRTHTDIYAQVNMANTQIMVFNCFLLYILFLYI